MGAISKLKGIELILEELAKNCTKVEIMANFGTKWQTPKDTFNKWYLIALAEHIKRNEAKEAIRVEQTTLALKEAINEAILSDLEIEAILCKMVSGNMKVEDIMQGVPVLRDLTPTEIIQASKVIYTKRGSNAPTKVAQTDKDGNDVKNAVSINFGMMQDAVVQVKEDEGITD